MGSRPVQSDPISSPPFLRERVLNLLVLLVCSVPLQTWAAQSEKHSPNADAPTAATEADRLRGCYGPYRANNDLLSYRLDVCVDPEKKFISGRNTVRFKMLTEGTRIQLDL